MILIVGLSLFKAGCDEAVSLMLSLLFVVSLLLLLSLLLVFLLISLDLPKKKDPSDAAGDEVEKER